MKKKNFTTSRVLFVLLLFAFGFTNVYSQTETDPSDNPSYDSIKANQGNENAMAFIGGNQLVLKDFTDDAEPGRSGSCFIPVDGSYTQIPRNDDGSYGPISLGFTFNLYGVNYTQAYINTNGNITFTGRVSSFSSSGFPFNTPMVAPLWGDVDTRNGGAIYYKLSGNRLIVTWNNVGYYSYQSGRPNQFQAILTNGNDPLIGIGNNVAFYYGDMRWTTGNASGGSGGFGGIPATVGINKGNGVNYVQVGRFNQNNSFYDGPGGTNDGVNYLDYQCFAFNASNASNQPPSVSGVPVNNTVNLDCGETQTISLSFIGPEVAQSIITNVNTGGLCDAIVNVSNGSVSVASVTITGSSCNQGSNVISFTATDNFNIPASTTVDIIVNVATCCTPPSLDCPSGISMNNSVDQCGAVVNYPAAVASGSPVPSITYSITSGSFFPVGQTEVFVNASNSCGTDACSFIVEVTDNQPPMVAVQDLIIELDVNGNASISVGQVDVGSSDNCGIASKQLSQLDFNCAHLGSNTTQLVVADIHGNQDSADFNVEVVDVTPPVVTYTNGTNYSSQDGIADCTYTGWSNNGGGFYTVESDNCSDQFTVVEEEFFNGNLVSTYTWPIGLGGSHPWRAWPVGVTTMVITVYDGSGNSSSGTYTQTVIDDEAPMVITQDIDAYLDASGFVSITESMVDFGSYDNCELASLTIDISDFSCEDVGYNVVTLTAIDIYGLVNSATANVIVIDEVVPNAVCQNIIVTLSGGSASITPDMVNDGSFDACGIAALELDVMSFNCSNIGSNSIELTVTDNNGNTSTCDATVEVLGEIPSCSIDVAFEDDTYTGGDGFTLFLGYGAQSLTATVIANGGAPFTYNWTGGAGYLSSISSENPVFTPSEDGVYDLVCEVTNAFGCTTICDVSICVKDIRAGGNGNNQKVYICHVPKGNPNKSKTLKVSVNAVPSHLSNHGGDALGYCGQECGDFKIDIESAELEQDHAHELIVYPNPTLNTFNVILDSHSSEDVNIEIFDHLGKRVISLEKLNANSIIELGEQLSPGFYYINVVQGDYSENIKVVKSN